MRYAELLFLVLLVVYHLVLLFPRHKRLFAANYLVFLAGMALSWNLAMEGFRWQTWPPTLLLLLDLIVLFPSFSTLRGRLPTPGILSFLAQGLRTLVAGLGLLLAVGSAVLAIAFPLPKVELTGGLSPGFRIVRFLPTADRPGLELQVWYPATGDLRPQPRQAAQSATWQRVRQQGGLPVFWQSYQEHLPTSLVVGGRLADPQTKYPVIYVAVPKGQSPGDFGYLLEDLASRGFVVAAGVPLPQPDPPVPTFDWATTLQEISRPFIEAEIWLEPEKTLRNSLPSDYENLTLIQGALRQLAAEPGDTLYKGLDWGRQGLWVWGPGPSPSEAQLAGLGIRCQIRAGVVPNLEEKTSRRELWIGEGLAPSTPPVDGRWELDLARLSRADLSDAAYLKPYLTFWGLKSQADSGAHGMIRQYQAAFFQFALWDQGTGATFGQMVPKVPGIVLSGR